EGYLARVARDPGTLPLARQYSRARERRRARDRAGQRRLPVARVATAPIARAAQRADGQRGDPARGDGPRRHPYAHRERLYPPRARTLGLVAGSRGGTARPLFPPIPLQAPEARATRRPRWPQAALDRLTKLVSLRPVNVCRTASVS